MGKGYNKIQLNPRQWELFKLLTGEPDKWFSQEEICSNISEYHYNDNERAHDRCPLINRDKKVINESFQVDKGIVQKNKCFKIINTIDDLKEAQRQRDVRISNISKEFSCIRRKAKKDGQFKLLTNEGVPMADSKNAKPAVEFYTPKQNESVKA